jgi:hypothetical protein
MSFITDIISATTISGGTFYGDGYNITNINEQELYLWDLVVQGNKLLNGGASYVSGLTFDVSVLNYIINGVIYDVQTFTTVTLNSGDTSFDRIDVIYVDSNGMVGVVEGTPSSNPVKPNLDGDTQVEISFVLVPNNGTTVGGIEEFSIYNEDLGPPSEWLFSSFGPQSLKISGDSIEDSYSGTTSIKIDGLTGSSITTYSSGFILSGTTGPVDINDYATIQFAIKNFSANTNTNRIRFKLLNQNGTANGNLVYMNGTSSPSSYIKYISNNVSTWQLISIPLWKFGVTNTNVYGFEVAFGLNTVTPARYRFDTLKFVEGVASSPPSNSWTKIKGDSTQTITATSPNATLTISGGTNLTSTIISPSTVRLDYVEPYKKYIALVTQSGTNNPTVQVLENTLGPITWVRLTAGNYEAQSLNEFTPSKTYLMVNQNNSSGITYLTYASDSQLFLQWYDFTGSQLDGNIYEITIEIRVYP